MEGSLFGMNNIDAIRLVKRTIESTVFDEWKEVDRDIEKDYCGTSYYAWSRRAKRKEEKR